MDWDPAQYVRYGDERGRPFVDLLARIGAIAPRQVIDLGCGPGTLTPLLLRRWPDARVTGIDSSARMIEAARARPEPGLTFELADVREWNVPHDADVLISNAALQWVPEHRELLRRWADALPAGGWLAFQVPANFDAPSHTSMRSLAASARWRDRLDGVLRHEDAVDTASSYAGLLLDAGLQVDAWETTYLHVLDGADPVLDWVRGTGLRPVLDALHGDHGLPDEAAEFTARYAALVREAYPRGPHGTVFPFRRIFVAARKP